MRKNWTMPNWMKKYRNRIAFDSERTIEGWMDYDNIYFMQDPRSFIHSARVKSQVELLERLHKKGIIK